MTKSISVAGRHRGVWVYAILLFAIYSLGQAEEQSQISRVPAGNRTYVFRPIAITPFPYGEFYAGRFLFINKEPSPVMVSGFGKPIHGKFEPRFVRYQIFENGMWKEIHIGYCATGAMDFSMKPGGSYDFHTFLNSFAERDSPLTGRIGFDVSAGAEGGWIDPD